MCIYDQLIRWRSLCMQNYNLLCRPSQTACTVTTVHVTFTQMVLHVHKNSCTVLVPLCKNNLNLPISDKDHYALRKYKQQLPQRFYFPTQYPRILTARVQHLILNLSHPYLKFQIHLIDLPQSSIQVLYGLQTDDDIRQCVNSSWTGMFNTKFVVRGQYIRFTTSLLISNYQKW